MNRFSKWAVTLTTTGALLAGTAATASATPMIPSLPPCEGYKYANAGTGEWLVSTADCVKPRQQGLWVEYHWSVEQGVTSQICFEGRGFNAQGQSKWYPLGCGASGQLIVDWGNVIAKPKIRAKARPGDRGGLYRWRWRDG